MLRIISSYFQPESHQMANSSANTAGAPTNWPKIGAVAVFCLSGLTALAAHLNRREALLIQKEVGGQNVLLAIAGISLVAAAIFSWSSKPAAGDKTGNAGNAPANAGGNTQGQTTEAERLKQQQEAAVGGNTGGGGASGSTDDTAKQPETEATEAAKAGQLKQQQEAARLNQENMATAASVIQEVQDAERRRQALPAEEAEFQKPQEVDAERVKLQAAAQNAAKQGNGDNTTGVHTIFVATSVESFSVQKLSLRGRSQSGIVVPVNSQLAIEGDKKLNEALSQLGGPLTDHLEGVDAGLVKQQPAAQNPDGKGKEAEVPGTLTVQTATPMFVSPTPSATYSSIVRSGSNNGSKKEDDSEADKLAREGKKIPSHVLNPMSTQPAIAAIQEKLINASSSSQASTPPTSNGRSGSSSNVSTGANSSFADLKAKFNQSGNSDFLNSSFADKSGNAGFGAADDSSSSFVSPSKKKKKKNQTGGTPNAVQQGSQGSTSQSSSSSNSSPSGKGKGKK